MRQRFRRGETAAALVDNLLREFAKLQEVTAADLGDPATATGPGSSESAASEAGDRGGRMRRTLRRRLLRWRVRTARAAGLI